MLYSLIAGMIYSKTLMQLIEVTSMHSPCCDMACVQAPSWWTRTVAHPCINAKVQTGIYLQEQHAQTARCCKLLHVRPLAQVDEYSTASRCLQDCCTELHPAAAFVSCPAVLDTSCALPAHKTAVGVWTVAVVWNSTVSSAVLKVDAPGP